MACRHLRPRLRGKPPSGDRGASLKLIPSPLACAPSWPIGHVDGDASDLMRLYAQSARDDVSTGGAWTKNPRALAGRLRRAQTFLRSLGIEITFSREGRTGSRMIRVSTRAENCVSSVSRVSATQGNGSRGDQAWLLGQRRPLLQTMLTVLTQTRPLNGLDYEITILRRARLESTPQLCVEPNTGRTGVLVQSDCGYLLVR